MGGCQNYGPFWGPVPYYYLGYPKREVSSATEAFVSGGLGFFGFRV